MRAQWWWGVGGWLLLAIVTTVLGVAAVNSLGAGLLDPADPPLSEADVARELTAASPDASSPRVPAGPPPSATAAPSGAAPASRVLATDGGSIVARCAAGQVDLVSWSPSPGYRADDVVRGPAAVASLTFERSGGKGKTELHVTVRCTGDEPSTSVEVDD